MPVGHRTTRLVPANRGPLTIPDNALDSTRVRASPVAELVCRAGNSVHRFVAGWMHRKAEEEAASSANGDDENAARRRSGCGDMRRISGEGHQADDALYARR